MKELNSRIPEGPLAEKWTNYKANQKLVNPANKRKLDIIVIGTGLAGASAAASLGEMGFNVKVTPVLMGLFGNSRFWSVFLPSLPLWSLDGPPFIN